MVKKVLRNSQTSVAPLFLYEGLQKSLRVATLVRWAKSRDSYHRIANQSYRCDSSR